MVYSIMLAYYSKEMIKTVTNLKRSREILDSHGNPTIEVDVRTANGFGGASVLSEHQRGIKRQWQS